MKHENADAPGYGAVAKSLHWLVVALVTAQFALGWTMPHIGRNTLPVGLIFWHGSIGMLLLAVVLVGLAWRFAHPVALLGGVPLCCRRGGLDNEVHVSCGAGARGMAPGAGAGLAPSFWNALVIG